MRRDISKEKNHRFIDDMIKVIELFLLKRNRFKENIHCKHFNSMLDVLQINMLYCKRLIVNNKCN